jgi:hypothetical protein
METLRQVWGVLLDVPDIIRASLPWDVGQSQWLLWGSVALFVVAGLSFSHSFGRLCGWAVERSFPPQT